MKNCYLVLGYKKQYYIRHKKADGNWTMISTKETDEELADKKMQNFIKNNVLNLPEQVVDDKFDNKNYNLLSLKEKYIEVFNAKDVKYLNYIFAELISIVGNKKIADFNVIDAEKFKQVKSENVWRGKKTVYACNLAIRSFKALFNKCIRAELINKNVWKYIKQIRVPEKKKLSFEDYEIVKLLDTINNKNIKNIVLFGLYTGCRLNEILNLKWENVNIKDNFIEVMNDDDFTTKSKKNRYIPISDKLKDVLKQERITKYVFVKDCGYKYTVGYVSKKFKYYIRKAKLPEKYHFHCLRHHFCTSILNNNIPVVVAQKLMGHANIQTTMNYTHVGTEEMRKAVNML